MSTTTKTKSSKVKKPTTKGKVKKTTKPKTTKTTKRKTTKCVTPECDTSSYTYPQIADEFPYGDGNPIMVRYYYAANHDTGKKFIISGDELPIQIAKVVAEDNTGEGTVAIVKISSPIAWLLTRVFKVEALDLNELFYKTDKQ
jgi:hypothetical protein